MSDWFRVPRKRRTRQHVIADRGVHYVEGHILAQGHTAQRVEKDYGYDLLMHTYDANGFLEPGLVMIQVKSTESVGEQRAFFPFDLDVRDYNLWVIEKSPVILVLFDAAKNRAYWLFVQQYFREHLENGPTKGAKRIRLRIPLGQRLNRRSVEHIRGFKWKPTFGVVDKAP